MNVTAEGSPLAQLDQVSKRFAAGDGGGIAPLAGVNLTVRAGETLAIVGPSGSGKSTLLQVLGGLAPPTAGVVRIAGRDLATLSDDERAVLRNEQFGFIFQMHHLLPQCTALENVLVPALVRERRASSDLVARGRMLLDRVGLAARSEHRPGELSGGECQRVAVARALILSPRLVLADEPTGALDADNAAQLTDLLLELHDHQGSALVVVTHWMPLAARMDRVLRLAAGSLQPIEVPA